MNKASTPTVTGYKRDPDTAITYLPHDPCGTPGSDLLWETPREVALPLIWLAASGGIGALQCLLMIAVPPDSTQAPGPPVWVGEVRMAGYAWLVLATSALLAAHMRLGPAVWGATLGFLFAQSMALAATIVREAIALWHDPRMLSYLTDILYLLQGGCHLALPGGALAITLLYFRAGSWYGVPHQRGWRTVGFSVGWMLLLTALLFGASQAAQYRFPQ